MLSLYIYMYVYVYIYIKIWLFGGLWQQQVKESIPDMTLPVYMYNQMAPFTVMERST